MSARPRTLECLATETCHPGKKTMSIVWHYTTFQGLRMIMAQAAIKASRVYRISTEGQGIVPMIVLCPKSKVTWFSANPEWEETANMAIADAGGSCIAWYTKQETKPFILSRIAIADETAPYNLEDYRKLESADIASQLDKFGMSLGANPNEWRFCFGDVPREKWLAAEIWRGEQWASYDPDLYRRRALAKHLGISVDGISIGPGLSLLCAGMTSVWTYYVQVDGWDDEFVFEEPGPEKAEVSLVKVDGISFAIRQGKPPLRVREVWPEPWNVRPTGRPSPR